MKSIDKMMKRLVVMLGLLIAFQGLAYSQDYKSIINRIESIDYSDMIGYYVLLRSQSLNGSQQLIVYKTNRECGVTWVTYNILTKVIMDVDYNLIKKDSNFSSCYIPPKKIKSLIRLYVQLKVSGVSIMQDGSIFIYLEENAKASIVRIIGDIDNYKYFNSNLDEYVKYKDWYILDYIYNNSKDRNLGR